MKIVGMEEFGAVGMVPVVAVPGPIPKLQSNGWGAIFGQEAIAIPGLFGMLPEHVAPEPAVPFGVRQGHVLLKYSGGKQFLTWTSQSNPNGAYKFS